MKRNLIWAIPAAILALTLGACGSDDDGPPRESPPVIDGWQTFIDPQTDAEFRCITQWRKVGYGAGMSMWCYEPERG